MPKAGQERAFSRDGRFSLRLSRGWGAKGPRDSPSDRALGPRSPRGAKGARGPRSTGGAKGGSYPRSAVLELEGPGAWVEISLWPNDLTLSNLLEGWSFLKKGLERAGGSTGSFFRAVFSFNRVSLKNGLNVRLVDGGRWAVAFFKVRGQRYSAIARSAAGPVPGLLRFLDTLREESQSSLQVESRLAVPPKEGLPAGEFRHSLFSVQPARFTFLRIACGVLAAFALLGVLWAALFRLPFSTRLNWATLTSTMSRFRMPQIYGGELATQEHPLVVPLLLSRKTSFWSRQVDGYQEGARRYFLVWPRPDRIAFLVAWAITFCLALAFLHPIGSDIFGQVLLPGTFGLGVGAGAGCVAWIWARSGYLMDTRGRCLGIIKGPVGFPGLTQDYEFLQAGPRTKAVFKRYRIRGLVNKEWRVFSSVGEEVARVQEAVTARYIFRRIFGHAFGLFRSQLAVIRGGRVFGWVHRKGALRGKSIVRMERRGNPLLESVDCRVIIGLFMVIEMHDPDRWHPFWSA